MSPDVLGWIASAVFLSRLVPQPARLLRTGVADGVSPMAALNAVVTDLGWLVYGLVVGLVPVWAVAVVSLFPGFLMVTLLAKRTTGSDVLGAALWLGASLAAWRFGALGALLGISVMVNNGPQVWVSLKESDLAGIAPGAWLIAIADASLWGAYGSPRATGPSSATAQCWRSPLS